MPKKARAAKKTTPRKPSSSARPSRSKGSKKKSTKKNKRSPARSNALGRAEREAQVAKLAALTDNSPRVAAAIRRHLAASERHGSDSPQAKQTYSQAKKLIDTERKRTSPGALCLPEYAPNDPREVEHVAEREQIHNEVFAGGVYHRLVGPLVNQMWGDESHLSVEICATNILHTGDVLRQMQPRDPMEKMLIAQALWTHGRIAHLNDLVVFEKSYKGIRVLNEAIDRASNTFRRQMLALSEYRRPPKAGGTVNKINQANIANQQVVQNGQTTGDPAQSAYDQAKEKPTNELGLNHDHPDQEPTRRPALPAQPKGQTFVTGRGEAQPALAPRDGTDD